MPILGPDILDPRDIDRIKAYNARKRAELAAEAEALAQVESSVEAGNGKAAPEPAESDQ